MVQHFKEITTFPSFYQLLRKDYIWKSIKTISIQVILNSDQCLNTHEAILYSFHLNPPCFLGLWHSSLWLFICKMADGNSLSFKLTRKLLITVNQSTMQLCISWAAKENGNMSEHISLQLSDSTFTRCFKPEQWSFSFRLSTG